MTLSTLIAKFKAGGLNAIAPIRIDGSLNAVCGFIDIMFDTESAEFLYTPKYWESALSLEKN